MIRPVYWLYCCYALLLFIACMLPVLPFVVFSSFLGSKKGGDLIYRACYCWDWSWMALTGIRHRTIPGSEPLSGKQYVFIANHISYLDIPLILRTIRGHSFRILGKAEMRRIPLFGYIYRHAVVMVDRSSADKRSKSVRALKGVLRQGISIFIFPEGTFNETHRPLKEFFDGAFRIAIETGTPLKPILFLDTFDRMHYSSLFSLKPGPSRAVFLPEIPVEGLTLDDLPALKDKAYHLMAAALVQYNASWIARPVHTT